MDKNIFNNIISKSRMKIAVSKFEGEEIKMPKKRNLPKLVATFVLATTVTGGLVYATGNTMKAIQKAIEDLGGDVVGKGVVMNIVELNGEKVNNKYDLDDIMQNATGEEIFVKVERNGETLEFNVKPTEVQSKVTGMYLDDKCQVIMVDKGSSSEKQGIQANDVITKINNEETNGDTNKIIEVLQQQGIGNIVLTIQRGNAEVKIEFTPDYVSTYYLGVNMKMAPDTFFNRCYYGLVETKTFVFSIVDNVRQLFTGNVGIDQMTGPIGIGEMVSQTNGFKEFIHLMALISISLGVTNLLPIPALDGGKILILIIEAIRGKPMKQENEINIQLLGFSILIALSIYVSYNDILRLF